MHYGEKWKEEYEGKPGSFIANHPIASTFIPLASLISGTRGADFWKAEAKRVKKEKSTPKGKKSPRRPAGAPEGWSTEDLREQKKRLEKKDKKGGIFGRWNKDAKQLRSIIRELKARGVNIEKASAALYEELEKIAIQESPVNQQQQQAQPMEQGDDAPQKQEIDRIKEDEESPVQGIVGTKMIQEDAKKARGIPILQPPPGYVFNPELQAFQPDPSGQGWMPEDQARTAALARSAYEKGQQDLTARKAQEAVDSRVSGVLQQREQASQQARQQAVQHQQQQQLIAQRRAAALARAPRAPSAVAGVRQPTKVPTGGIRQPAPPGI